MSSREPRPAPLTVAPTTAMLRRGMLARVRTIRVHEFVAWIAIVVLALSVRAPANFGVLLFGAAGVVVRLAIATEWVRCDVAGVTWRSLFVTHSVSWDEVASIDVAARQMSLRFTRPNYSAMSPCLTIERVAGSPPMSITPSIWTSVIDQGEFIAAARLISPTEWALEAADNSGHRPSGKRVGHPIERHHGG